jgi:hypothetical protein
MGQNGAVLGQIPHISLKRKSTKGVPKSGRPTFTKYTFQTPGSFGIIKEGLLSCFGMNRGPGWGVMGCNVETQCQNLDCTSVQTTGVVLLAPNFMNHLAISFKHDLRQKRHISGHLLSWPLSVKVRRILCQFFAFFGPKLQPKTQERASDGRQTFWFFLLTLIIYYIHVRQTSMFWTNMAMETSKILHFWNCT